MKSLLLISALLVTSICLAQTEGNIQLYGFVQSVAGNRNSELAENGTSKETIHTGKNYLLYAVATSRIYPAQLWIEGVKYGVTIKIITTTPVTYHDETNIGSPEKTLIPATKQKVVQLIPIPQSVKPVSATVKALAGKNALVLVYKHNGKFFYKALQTLTELSAAALQ